MPVYKDTAANRRLGRVGKHWGKSAAKKAPSEKSKKTAPRLPPAKVGSMRWKKEAAASVAAAGRLAQVPRSRFGTLRTRREMAARNPAPPDEQGIRDFDEAYTKLNAFLNDIMDSKSYEKNRKVGFSRVKKAFDRLVKKNKSVKPITKKMIEDFMEENFPSDLYYLE